MGLRARNASAGGAIAFWLGNSLRNPATLVFMGFVLGWKWTGLRLVLAMLLVLRLGWLANRLVTPQEVRAADDRLALLAQQQVEAGNVVMRWLRILARMAVRLLPEYIVLVLLLSAARARLFPHIGPDVTSSIGWIVAFAVAGMLFVIPTAGEVPIIQAMLAYSGNARAGHGRGPSRGIAHDAAARECAVVCDARGLFPATGVGGRRRSGRAVWCARRTCDRRAGVLTSRR